MIEKCKICDSDLITQISLYDIDMIHCKTCDVHYLSNFGSRSEITDYYEKDYKITSKDNIETEFRRIFRLPEQIALIREIGSYQQAPARIIDIGCDKAYFIDEARRYGYDCTGIELSKSAHDYAKLAGIELKRDFENIEGKFDIAVMWHSLEHIPEPHRFLDELKLHMNDGAYLFVRVPAFDSIWRKTTGKKWIWFQPQNHFFHYSAAALRKLLIMNGFDVQMIEHRKPNTRHTKKMYRMAKSIFNENFEYKTSLRRRLSRIYEDITGVELYAIGRLQ